MSEPNVTAVHPVKTLQSETNNKPNWCCWLGFIVSEPQMTVKKIVPIHQEDPEVFFNTW